MKFILKVASLTNSLREKLSYVYKYMCVYIHYLMDNILILYLLHPEIQIRRCGKRVENVLPFLFQITENPLELMIDCLIDM